jgi:hypothetical protein
MDHTKIQTVDLDSSRQDLSVRGLGFVVAISTFLEFIFRVRLLGVQSSFSNILNKFFRLRCHHVIPYQMIVCYLLAR